MNLSFVVAGIALGCAALLVWRSWPASRASKFTFMLLGTSGLGTVIIGFVPENVGSIHVILSAVLLAVFNIGVASAFWLPGLPVGWRCFSLGCGCVGLAALVLLGLHIDLSLGLGGIERLADYTPDLWVICFSAYGLTRLGARHLP